MKVSYQGTKDKQLGSTCSITMNTGIITITNLVKSINNNKHVWSYLVGSRVLGILA